MQTSANTVGGHAGSCPAAQEPAGSTGRLAPPFDVVDLGNRDVQDPVRKLGGEAASEAIDRHLLEINDARQLPLYLVVIIL